MLSIKSAVKNQSDVFYHSAFQRLAYLTDTYGPRLWGGDALESFLVDLKSISEGLGLTTRLEPVTNFTKWERGHEDLVMLSPRYKNELSLGP